MSTYDDFIELAQRSNWKDATMPNKPEAQRARTEQLTKELADETAARDAATPAPAVDETAVDETAPTKPAHGKTKRGAS